MKLKKGKLFWKKEDLVQKIYCIQWNEQQIDYYSFLKENVEIGYHQVIISSEMFISFLRYIVTEEEYSLVNIDFMEEDNEYAFIINCLIDKAQSNAAYIINLIEELQLVAEKSSIEIKRMHFKKRINDIAVQFYIQSNGILGVTEQSFETTIPTVNAFIERCLFG